jgi:hypothetical protein
VLPIFVLQLRNTKLCGLRDKLYVAAVRSVIPVQEECFRVTANTVKCIIRNRKNVKDADVDLRQLKRLTYSDWRDSLTEVGISELIGIIESLEDVRNKLLALQTRRLFIIRRKQ